MKNKDLLKLDNIQYLGGDNDWYNATIDDNVYSAPESPIAVSGPMPSIAVFMEAISADIIPTDKDITWNDANGNATVTLKSSGGGGSITLKLEPASVHITYYSTSTVSNLQVTSVGRVTDESYANIVGAVGQVETRNKPSSGSRDFYVTTFKDTYIALVNANDYTNVQPSELTFDEEYVEPYYMFGSVVYYKILKDGAEIAVGSNSPA